MTPEMRDKAHYYLDKLRDLKRLKHKQLVKSMDNPEIYNNENIDEYFSIKEKIAFIEMKLSEPNR